MASAWGNSWASAWGNSWGNIAPAAPPVTPITPTGGSGSGRGAAQKSKPIRPIWDRIKDPQPARDTPVEAPQAQPKSAKVIELRRPAGAPLPFRQLEPIQAPAVRTPAVPKRPRVTLKSFTDLRSHVDFPAYVEPPRTARALLSEPDDVGSGTACVGISARALVTDAPDTGFSTGSVAISGKLTATEDADTVNAKASWNDDDLLLSMVLHHQASEDAEPPDDDDFLSMIMMKE